MKKNAGIQPQKNAGSIALRTETFRFFRFGILFCVSFLFSLGSQAQQAQSAQPNIGIQRFQIRSESKSFEKTKFKSLKEVKAAVAKYRRSFNSRVRDLDKRCSNHFGPGYKFNGLSIKERAIGYMNEDLPIDKFQWKRLVAEVFIQCINSQPAAAVPVK